MPTRYPMTFGQRQAGLGPASELSFVPFPFEEVMAIEKLDLMKKAAQPSIELPKTGNRDIADDPWYNKDFSNRERQLSEIYDKYGGNFNDLSAMREFQQLKRDPQFAQNELNRERSDENISKFEDAVFKLKTEGLSDANAFAADLKVAKWRSPNELGKKGTEAYGIFDLGVNSITKNKNRNEYVETFMNDAFKKGAYTEYEEKTGQYLVSSGKEGLAYDDLLRMGGIERIDTGQKDKKGNPIYALDITDPTRMSAYFDDDSGRNLVNELIYNSYVSTDKIPDEEEISEAAITAYKNLVNNQAIEKSGFIDKQSLQETAEYKARITKKVDDEELFRIYQSVPTSVKGVFIGNPLFNDPKSIVKASAGVIGQIGASISELERKKQEYINKNKGKGVLLETAKFDASIDQLKRQKVDYETYTKSVYKKAADELGFTKEQYSTVLDLIQKKPLSQTEMRAFKLKSAGIDPYQSEDRTKWEAKAAELLQKDAVGKDIVLGTIRTPSKELNNSLEEEFRVNYKGKAIFNAQGEDISYQYKTNEIFGGTDPKKGEIHFLGVSYNPDHGLVNQYTHDIKSVKEIEGKEYITTSKSDPIFVPAEGGLSEMIDNFRGDKESLRTMITGGITNIVNTPTQKGTLFGVGVEYIKASDKPGGQATEQYKLTIRNKGKTFIKNVSSMEEVINQILSLHKR